MAVLFAELSGRLDSHMTKKWLCDGLVLFGLLSIRVLLIVQFLI